MARLTLGLVAILAAAPTGGVGQPALGEDGRVPVLAELFTAEGCSSCPPADRMLAALASEQPFDGVYVVALSEHVTYWDHLGWKDPFSSPRFTERQNRYAHRFRLDDVFTPQLVIDGHMQMVGSDAGQFRNALLEARRTPKAKLRVAASLASDGSVMASVSGPGLQAGAGEGRELLWAVAEDDLVVEVPRGENAKRTLQHSGVVRTLITRKLQSGNLSETVAIKLQPGWKRENLRVVAFVQSTKSGRVLSVGWSKLPAPH